MPSISTKTSGDGRATSQKLRRLHSSVRKGNDSASLQGPIPRYWAKNASQLAVSSRHLLHSLRTSRLNEKLRLRSDFDRLTTVSNIQCGSSLSTTFFLSVVQAIRNHGAARKFATDERSSTPR